MSWPIPKITPLEPLPPPQYARWFIALLILLLGGVALVQFTSHTPLMWVLMTAVPACAWLMAFGLTLNRYEQSCAAAWAWKEASDETRRQWRQWGSRQVLSGGAVLLSPEQDAVTALIDGHAPLSPHKGRALFGHAQTPSERLHTLDAALNQRCPGYADTLEKICLLTPADAPHDALCEVIHLHWGMTPERLTDLSSLAPYYENAPDAPLLVLALQQWEGGQPSSSEFAAAHIFCSAPFAHAQGWQGLTGISRPLPGSTASLADDLEQMFAYSRTDKQLKHVWLGGIEPECLPPLASYATAQNLAFSASAGMYVLDRYFGPPGPLSWFFALTLACEAARQTTSDQLLFVALPDASPTLFSISAQPCPCK